MYKIGDKVGPHNIILLERLYRDHNKKWVCRFQCPYCDNTFDTVLGNVGNGDTQSCGCWNKKQIRNPEHKFKRNLINQKFGYLTVIKDSGERRRGYILWECLCDCGRATKVITSSLTSGDTISCGKCGHHSKGEVKLEEILKENNIKHIREYRFQDCKDKHPLPFDFYLPDYNCCIEYNGKQHYEDVGWGQQRFDIIVYHDDIKRQYCKNNNITLIEIPYTDYSKLDFNYLKEKIN